MPTIHPLEFAAGLVRIRDRLEATITGKFRAGNPRCAIGSPHAAEAGQGRRQESEGGSHEAEAAAGRHAVEHTGRDRTANRRL